MFFWYTCGPYNHMFGIHDQESFISKPLTNLGISSYLRQTFSLKNNLELFEVFNVRSRERKKFRMMKKILREFFFLMNKCPWINFACFKKVESEGEGRVARSKNVKDEKFSQKKYRQTSFYAIFLLAINKKLSLN